MKARRFLGLLGATALVASLIAGPATVAQAKKAKKATVVAEDAVGDWGDGTIPAELGAALGQDLVGAEIAMADKKTINFVLKVSQLPPNGGVPEASRYVWSLAVDGDYVELDGKWTNYSRGACDPTSNSCPPPRDPGQQPFLVRGNCETVEAVTTCEEVGIVQAAFDAAAGTITIPVPAELINAKKGSKITAGSSDFTSGAGGNIVSSPSAFLSVNNAAQLDAMPMTGTFAVK